MTDSITPYTIKTTKVPTKPGCWDYTYVEIYKDGEKVGEYNRHYHNFAEQTFCPVKSGDNWFALYSEDYQAIKVMSLPDCRDITVPDKEGYGFCPVEIYVPHYRKRTWLETRTSKMVKETQTDKEGKEYEVWQGQKCDPYMEESQWLYFPGDSTEDFAEKGPLSDWLWTDFGFVAGCFWGDDSSWKIQHLDLRQISEGIVLNQPKFGYIEIARGDMSLRDAIDTSQWQDGENWMDRVTIIHQTCFDRETGKEL